MFLKIKMPQIQDEQNIKVLNQDSFSILIFLFASGSSPALRGMVMDPTFEMVTCLYLGFLPFIFFFLICIKILFSWSRCFGHLLKFCTQGECLAGLTLVLALMGPLLATAPSPRLALPRPAPTSHKAGLAGSKSPGKRGAWEGQSHPY